MRPPRRSPPQERLSPSTTAVRRARRRIAEQTLRRRHGRASLRGGFQYRRRGRLHSSPPSTPHFGGIDILVNNAAMLRVANTESTTDELWDEIVRVDLTSPFRCCAAGAAIMRERGGGAIVNVASIAGVNGGAMGPGYAAARAVSSP